MRFPFLPVKKSYSFIKIAARKDHVFPHFNVMSDNGVAAMFLETVADNPEDAWAFVSRHYAGNLDLQALHDVLRPSAAQVCPFLINATYESEPKNRRIRSVLVTDAEGRAKGLLHLHMVKEPDKYGQWKIYGVEQE